MERPGEGHEPWWENAVVYQVYLRSFADGNGDGIGDIADLRSRLDYVQSLGVDAIWVNPWYRSPMNDGGYDVSDYRQIDPLFGTIDEVRDLVNECRDRGIRLLGDLVPNHTSSEHEWFQAAVASPKGAQSAFAITSDRDVVRAVRARPTIGRAFLADRRGPWSLTEIGTCTSSTSPNQT
jgi:glycosidase